MPHIGIPELIVVLVIALLVFGPKKLPGLGKSVGDTIKEFKKSSSDIMGSNQTKATDQQE